MALPLSKSVTIMLIQTGNRLPLIRPPQPRQWFACPEKHKGTPAYLLTQPTNTLFQMAVMKILPSGQPQYQQHNIPFSGCFSKKAGLCLRWPNPVLLQYLLVPIIALLSACASTPEPEPITSIPLPSAVNYALSLRGAPYRYGKASPNEGFDCSGFVWHVYGKQGIRLPRTAKDMALSLPSVPKQAMISGDLVFFNINGKPFSHVGIYIDKGHFIHAPSQRTGHVLVSDLKNHYWQQRFMGVRRPR